MAAGTRVEGRGAEAVTGAVAVELLFDADAEEASWACAISDASKGAGRGLSGGFFRSLTAWASEHSSNVATATLTRRTAMRVVGDERVGRSETCGG